MKKVIIMGGLGNGSVIAHAMADAFARGNRDMVCSGFLNDRDDANFIEGFPVLGGFKDIPRLLSEGFYFINTIFKPDEQEDRIALFEKCGIPDERLAVFVHPMSYIAPYVELAPGCVIMPNVSISSGTRFGRGCRVMVGATIGHNSVFDDYCFFAANCCTGAYLKLGRGVTVSLNSTIREYVEIGNYSTVAMGAVVLKNIGENEIWAGNPAKLLKRIK